MTPIQRLPNDFSACGKSRAVLATLLREAQSHPSVVCDPHCSAVDQFLEILLLRRRPDLPRFEDRPMLGFNIMKFLKPTPHDDDPPAACPQ